MHSPSTPLATPPQLLVRANVSVDGSSTIHFVTMADGTRALAESEGDQPSTANIDHAAVRVFAFNIVQKFILGNH